MKPDLGHFMRKGHRGGETKSRLTIEDYSEAVEGNGVKWRGMRCPKCKVDYPKGAKFCPSCGYEPLNRSNVRRTLTMYSIAIVIQVVVIILSVIAEHWISAGAFGLVLGIWVYMLAAHFRHVQLTKPTDSETTVTSDGR